MKLPSLTTTAPPLSFLGIDLALRKTGIVKLFPASPTDKAPRVESALINTEKLKLVGIKRWVYLRDAINEWIPETTLAAIEGYALHALGRAKIPLAEIGGIIRMELNNQLGDTFLEIPPTELKAFSGNGRADKKQVIANVKERFGFLTKDDNIADAYVLAKLAQMHFCLSTGKFISTQNSGMLDFQISILSSIPKYPGRL